MKRKMIFNKFYADYNTQKYKTKNIPEVQQIAKKLLNGSPLTTSNKWLFLKIKNHIERSGIDYTINDVLKQIINSELAASLFCKPATKQNSSENCQKDYLKEYRNIELINLPSSGAHTWRFISDTGKLLQTPKIEGKTSHSFDFKYITKRHVYFIMAKVTTTQGGGQNQQRQEMLDIIDDMKLYFLNNPKSNVRFALLLDGDSYDGGGITSFLTKVGSEKRIIITNSNTFNPK
jgi:hypothetical protein